ncbi:MAG: glycoside hydrolase family 15 protein, partial [Mycobacterium sp.]
MGSAICAPRGSDHVLDREKMGPVGVGAGAQVADLCHRCRSNRESRSAERTAALRQYHHPTYRYGPELVGLLVYGEGGSTGMRYSLAQLAMDQAELQAIAQHMYPLMLRNIASEGFLFSDPLDQNSYSGPGCVLAAPSFPAITPGTSQDYVFNWVRDAAITAMEVAAAHPPVRPGAGAQTLVDYVNFAQLCQKNAIQAGSPTRACFRINGDLRDWTDQSDGPAVQTLAILSLFSQLDAPTQAVALAVANANVGILMNAYQQPTFNLWEEVRGNSFFARATQLRCLQEVQTNTIGIQVPGNIADAIGWLQSQLQG